MSSLFGLYLLEGHNNAIWFVAISPNSLKIATASAD
jgi:hypothetical protein